MAELPRRTFLAFAGALGASVAVPIGAHAAPNKRRIKPGTSDWNPTALWQTTDLWGAH